VRPDRWEKYIAGDTPTIWIGNQNHTAVFQTHPVHRLKGLSRGSYNALKRSHAAVTFLMGIIARPFQCGLLVWGKILSSDKALKMLHLNINFIKYFFSFWKATK